METETSEHILDTIRRVWGYDSLRPMQARAIEAGLDGRDCLTVLPTGGGKSLCYQVPPLISGRTTVVISPLIALMRDQVRALELNDYPAAAVHSGLDAGGAREIFARLRAGALRLLLVAPERAVTDGFCSTLAVLTDAGALNSIAVDEAHCISQWGHDFRPEYRRLAELRRVAPGVAMQAFTATATPRVRVDIVEQLSLRDPEILVGTFDRPNLTYRVRARHKPEEQIGEAIGRMNARGGGGVIVYCLSRAGTEGLADKLRGLGHNAEAYHAGLDPRRRHRVEERFTNETLDVVVATVAFGMGIDRSNVRLVVHANVPKSVEAYQQETGRAGRDGLPAECLLLYAPSDAGKWEQLIRRSAEEGHADEAATRAQLELVRQMRRLVTSMQCRHRALSEHFGQAYENESCGACDVCLGETEAEPDSRRVTQILMSAVARVDQRFGAGHVIDVVRGRDTEKVTRFGHDRLQLFGLLESKRKTALVGYVDQLVAAGALEQDPEFGTLRFGPRGVGAMKGEIEIKLARPIGTGSKKAERRRGKGPAPAPTDLIPEDLALFEKLRSLVRDIAVERGLPPYMIFTHRTLVDMIQKRPATLDDMRLITGVGEAKLEAFGEAFLRALHEE
ncbi:MAG: ATP-dependent DNA helicase RecQ [Phycisphaeraceae bacterium]|nr:MAG: ATP-dependent DNA helicase RecQ [Phycisphaeraceae bacterium]